MNLLVFNLEAILQGFVSNMITIVLVTAAIGLAIMYFVSKLTGSVRVGSFAAGGVLLLGFIWLAKEGHLLPFLSNIN